MDVTVYLPDELGNQVEERDWPRGTLSRMLQDAIRARIAEEDAVATTLKDAEVVKLRLENEEGHAYVGRITGALIAEQAELEVYLTDEENVVVYDSGKRRYWVLNDPADQLADYVTGDALIEAMTALGLEAEVDLDI